MNRKNIVSVLMAVFMLLCILPIGIFAGGEIPIDEAHFPDANFREFILTGNWFDYNYNEHRIDADGSGTLSPSEMAAVKGIDVSKREIGDLTGINYFIALNELDCSYNKLTSLDISQNTNLKYFTCFKNELTGLDISSNTALESMTCDYNNISALNVSNNPKLDWLSCTGNKLTALDVGNNIKLTNLYCADNLITSFDVSKNVLLSYFYCNGNELTELDISKNTLLNTLNCAANHLKELDLTNNTKLWHLNFSKNPLQDPHQPMETLSEETIANLFTLRCYGLGLTELDVSPYKGLKELDCSDNALTALDISNNKLLRIFNCSDNSLTALDISNNPDLRDLNCSGNDLPNIDLSHNEHIVWFNYGYNPLQDPHQPLETLSREAVKELRFLVCDGLYLTELDLTPYTNLLTLDCSCNSLTTLDLSCNTALEELDCSDNNLTSLDLSRNAMLEKLVCLNNGYRVPSDPFDLSELPGNFDAGKTSDWEGCTLNGSIITFTAETAHYTYDCGGGHYAEFTLLSPDYTAQPGDYNGDGNITVEDAVMILRAALGLAEGGIPGSADFDGDGEIAVQDAVMTLRAAIGF